MKKSTDSNLANELVSRSDDELSVHKDQLAMILKTPAGFSCGMCGKHYKELKKAWDCVTLDVAKMQFLPIKTISELGIIYTQCLLCAKNYTNPEDAALCLEQDVAKRQNDMPAALKEHVNSLIQKTLKGQKITKRDALSPRQAASKVKSTEKK